MSQFPTNKNPWKWTAMIMQPQYATEEIFNATAEEIAKKNLPTLSQAGFQNFREGLSAQIMHIGSYSAEGPTIEKLHHHIKEHGYTCDGLIQKHHEIYLSDYARQRRKSLRQLSDNLLPHHENPDSRIQPLSFAKEGTGVEDN